MYVHVSYNIRDHRIRRAIPIGLGLAQISKRELRELDRLLRRFLRLLSPGSCCRGVAALLRRKSGRADQSRPDAAGPLACRAAVR